MLWRYILELGRFYDREKRFIVFICLSLLFATLAFISFSIFKDRAISFERYLLNNDYENLYKHINRPDFSQEIFKAYMNYNFGSDISIAKKTKNKNGINYKIITSQGEKIISLESDGKDYLWNFNDYIYNWVITIPKSAKLYIENQSFENKDGQVEIEKIPFGVYDIKVSMESCEPYSHRIMAGQNVEIKMSISKDTIEKCKNIINEYLMFKESAINNRFVSEVSCVDKQSGVYKEVVDEVEWLKTEDFKCTKSLIGIEVVNSTINKDNIIILDVKEIWSVKINNEGNLSEKNEEHFNRYFINTDDKFIISQIKTIK
jgi:hypothetical protein